MPPTDPQRLQRAWLLVKPGMKKSELARLMNIGSPTNLDAFLATLEHNGYLLSEDDHGRLYQFCRSDAN